MVSYLVYHATISAIRWDSSPWYVRKERGTIVTFKITEDDIFKGALLLLFVIGIYFR